MPWGNVAGRLGTFLPQEGVQARTGDDGAQLQETMLRQGVRNPVFLYGKHCKKPWKKGPVSKYGSRVKMEGEKKMGRGSSGGFARKLRTTDSATTIRTMKKKKKRGTDARYSCGGGGGGPSA